ncbi:phospholipase D family protein [Myxococcota bacterium]|nr:phospholipase D family protein [Myxococcota bacterium]
MQRDGNHIPFVTSGAYPIRGGNRVAPLVDGEPAFRRICQAIEAAKKSVWVTIAFIEQEFLMPDRRGSLFDVLDRARDRGLDVRVIFWRSTPLHEESPGTHFFGTREERGWLAARGSSFLARWDRGAKLYCQHQKSWLIDAGELEEIAFVGGINLDVGSMVPPGHPPSRSAPSGDAYRNTHDVYAEIEGPSATDVHHNFVQRWNETSDRGEVDGVWPPDSDGENLPFPRTASRIAGPVPVQIQRTVRRGQYQATDATPDGQPHDLEQGDYSIVDQYLEALRSARHTIYFEDQAIGSPEIVDGLHAALGRGVRVVFLAPADPNPEMLLGRRSDGSHPFWASLARLGEYERFTLAGLASSAGAGQYENVYVHAKICLVDDVWCTIGSTNIANRSFYGDTELNASFWHGPTVKKLRCQLLREHLNLDTTTLDDVRAFARYHEIAQANAQRRTRGDPLQGLAFRLNPSTYAA